MISDAIEYPSRGDDPAKTIIIGSLLNAFWWILFIPVILVNGYYVHVLRTTIGEEEDPPEFDDWGELAKDGLFLWVIQFVYFLVPTVVTVGLFLFTGTLGMLSGSSDVAIATLLLSSLLAFLVGGLLYLVFGYFAFAAIANYADAGRLGAGFAVSEVIGVSTTMDYFKGWLAGVAILVVGFIVTSVITSIIGFVLGLIPIIGLIAIPINWVIWSFAAFVLYVAAYRALGRGYYLARSESRTTEEPQGTAA